MNTTSDVEDRSSTCWSSAPALHLRSAFFGRFRVATRCDVSWTFVWLHALPAGVGSAHGILGQASRRINAYNAAGAWLPAGDLVAIVGEASYQPAIAKACGSTTWEYVRYEVGEVAVVPEPHNEHDPNAVAIFIGGDKVGYLSRGDALDYRPAMDALCAAGYDAGICRGWIAGRGPDGDTENLGVFLCLADSGELLAALT